MTYTARHPELDQLASILGREAALKLSAAPGGWRSLSVHELHGLALNARQSQIVLALQELVRTGRPKLSPHVLACAKAVGELYSDRLADLDYEVVLALAVDGRNQLRQELEVARGGAHGAALLPRDVLRPLIRAGASAAILVHNHPSGDPRPSVEDVHMTRELARAAAIVGIELLDHVVIGARGGGWASCLELGVLEPAKENHSEQRVAE